MRDREKLLDTIRALLSKTREHGCTEAEELTALDKAKAMMDAYAVTDADLELSKEEGAILCNERADPSDPHGIKWQLSGAVAEFCGVQIFRGGKHAKNGLAKRQKDRGFVFVGARSDCDFAEFLLCDHLRDFVHAELYAHLLGCLAPGRERKTIMRNFVQGCTGRISDRLLAACKRSEKARTSNGRELVVIQQAAIVAKMNEGDIRLHIARDRPGNFDEAAYEAGKLAGNRATFGRPINGPASALRLGRGG